jgi:hypothetical protein
MAASPFGRAVLRWEDTGDVGASAIRARRLLVTFYLAPTAYEAAARLRSWCWKYNRAFLGIWRGGRHIACGVAEVRSLFAFVPKVIVSTRVNFTPSHAIPLSRDGKSKHVSWLDYERRIGSQRVHKTRVHISSVVLSVPYSRYPEPSVFLRLLSSENP